MKLKNLLPNDNSDFIGILTTVGLVTLIAINNGFALYEQSKGNSGASLFLTLSQLVILFNIFGNMYKAISVDTTIDSIDLPTVLLPEWRYCSFCEQNAPPRCFHCFSCNKCVLKRHNHCLFLGKCAGHKNQRYYLLFIFYVWLGTLVSNIINTDYYLDIFVYKPDLVKLFISLMPLFAVILGMINPFDFFPIFLNSITLILFLIMLLYLIINVRLALRGQTWHENAKKIKIYDLGWLQNVKEILGHNWMMVLVFPFGRSKLPSDGTRFSKNIISYVYQAENEQESRNSHLVKRREVQNVYDY